MRMPRHCTWCLVGSLARTPSSSLPSSPSEPLESRCGQEHASLARPTIDDANPFFSFAPRARTVVPGEWMGPGAWEGRAPQERWMPSKSLIGRTHVPRLDPSCMSSYVLAQKILPTVNSSPHCAMPFNTLRLSGGTHALGMASVGAQPSPAGLPRFDVGALLRCVFRATAVSRFLLPLVCHLVTPMAGPVDAPFLVVRVGLELWGIGVGLQVPSYTSLGPELQ